MHLDPSFVEWLWRIGISAGLGLVLWGMKHGVARFLNHADDTAAAVTKRLEGTAREFRAAIDGQNSVLDNLERGHAEMRNSLTEIRTVLIGINGDNGLNGTVKAIDARVQHLERGSLEMPAQRAPRRRRKAS